MRTFGRKGLGGGRIRKVSALLSRTRMSAAIAAILLAAVGCTSSSTHAEPSLSRASHPAPTPHRSASLARFSPGLTACGTYETPFSRVQLPDPGAPAYVGEGPHLAVVGEHIGPHAKGMVHITPSTFSLPSAWRALNAKRTEPDPSHAQLIVCLSQVAEQAGTRIGTCAYNKAQVDVYPADYTFDIYTARTGRRVSQLTIGGDESAPMSCPASVVTVDDVNFRVAQRISEAALSSRLRPLVTGPAH